MACPGLARRPVPLSRPMPGTRFNSDKPSSVSPRQKNSPSHSHHHPSSPWHARLHLSTEAAPFGTRAIITPESAKQIPEPISLPHTERAMAVLGKGGVPAPHHPAQLGSPRPGAPKSSHPVAPKQTPRGVPTQIPTKASVWLPASP